MKRKQERQWNGLLLEKREELNLFETRRLEVSKELGAVGVQFSGWACVQCKGLGLTHFPKEVTEDTKRKPAFVGKSASSGDKDMKPGGSGTHF